MDKFDADGLRLPIKIDSTSNGEFEPVPLTPTNEKANRLALERADQLSRRKGQTRRKFLVSACGAASTLMAMNTANAFAGKRGGFFELRDESALDEASALAEVGGDEFIFDVQGHYVNPEGDWLRRQPPNSRPYSGFGKASCELANEPGDRSYLNCLSESEFIKDVFMDSDTDIMVLSFVPSTRENEPVTIEDADQTRQIVAELEGSKRLMIHGRVNPNQEGDLEAMDELAENWNISAFKTYTQYGPGGIGYFLHDDVGMAMIERARRLGVRNICIHKGLPFGPRSYEHSQCSDIGVVAKMYPDMNFLIYHSGFVTDVREQEFVEGAGPRRHRHLGSVADRQRSGAELQCVRRTRQHLALSDARPGQRGPRHGQTAEILWREQCALGHRLDLVRLAPGPNSGFPHFPDQRGISGTLWLPGDHR